MYKNDGFFPAFVVAAVAVSFMMTKCDELVEERVSDFMENIRKNAPYEVLINPCEADAKDRSDTLWVLSANDIADFVEPFRTFNEEGRDIIIAEMLQGEDVSFKESAHDIFLENCVAANQHCEDMYLVSTKELKKLASDLLL